MKWFEVDKEGLSKIVAKRGKEFAIFELIQNCWDTDTKTVEVNLTYDSKKKAAHIVVIDEDPEGFADLTHAYTLFAESIKKNDATKRGRFNLGEKLVLALCNRATITSTKGTVIFNKDGRTKHSGSREKGSCFDAYMPMKRREFDACLEKLSTLIAPQEMETFINGEVLAPRTPAKTFTEVLQTEISDDKGRLRKTARQTEVRVYEPAEGEQATLYEMGIPVVESGDKFHVDIQQKIPLNLDRDNVTPAFLRAVRTFVFNHTHDLLEEDDATSTWVKEATGDSRCTNEGAEKALTLKYGEKRVAFDPTDQEANRKAAAEGYAVIHGRSISPEQWEIAKRAGAVQRAGEVCPTQKAVFGSGKDCNVPESEYTGGMKLVIDYYRWLAPVLVGEYVTVEIVRVPDQNFVACYKNPALSGDEITRALSVFNGAELRLNLSKLGHKWFADQKDGIQEKGDDLLVHELGHHYAENHLSVEYYDALTKLSARFVALALREPAAFKPYRKEVL
jgi:hypothetical protein